MFELSVELVWQNVNKRQDNGEFVTLVVGFDDGIQKVSVLATLTVKFELLDTAA
jgi:hypothetical protein